MTIKEKEAQLIEDFELFEDWMDKYGYIIDLGKSGASLDDASKREELLINGCQSRVWLEAEMKDGQVYYRADSDAVIPKGIAAMLTGLFSGHRPDEILDFSPVFVDRIGLGQHLSPTRSNGLSAMIQQIKNYALAFKSKEA